MKAWRAPPHRGTEPQIAEGLSSVWKATATIAQTPPLLGTKPVGVETGTGTSLHNGSYSIQALDPTWFCMGCWVLCWVLCRVLHAALGAVQCAACCIGCCTVYCWVLHWMLYSVLGAALGAAQGAGCCIGCCMGCWLLHWVLQLGGGVQQVPQPQAGHDFCSPPRSHAQPHMCP